MVEIHDKGMRAYLNRLRDLEDLEVVAGHVGANALEPHPSGGGSATKLDVSRFVQFGTRNMPPRPYMDLAAADLQSDAQIAKLNKRAIDPRSKKDALSALKPLGKRTARAIRNAIVRVGAVDTGTTRDTVRYQIRKDGRVLHEGAYNEALGTPRKKRSKHEKRIDAAKKSARRAAKQVKRAAKKAKRTAKRALRRAKRALR